MSKRQLNLNDKQQMINWLTGLSNKTNELTAELDATSRNGELKQRDRILKQIMINQTGIMMNLVTIHLGSQGKPRGALLYGPGGQPVA